MTFAFLATAATAAQTPVDEMRQRDAGGTDEHENYFAGYAFFKNYVGEKDQANTGNEEKQRSDFAVLLEITGQQRD